MPTHALFCIYDTEMYELFTAADRRWVERRDFEGVFISEGVHWKYKNIDSENWCVVVSTSDDKPFVIVSNSDVQATALLSELLPARAPKRGRTTAIPATTTTENG